MISRLSDAPPESPPREAARVYVGPGTRAYSTYPPADPAEVELGDLSDLPAVSELPLPERSDVPGLLLSEAPTERLLSFDEPNVQSEETPVPQPRLPPPTELPEREYKLLEHLAQREEQAAPADDWRPPLTMDELELRRLRAEEKTADRMVAVAEHFAHLVSKLDSIVDNQSKGLQRGGMGQEVCQHIPAILGVKDRRKAEALVAVLSTLATLGLTLYNAWMLLEGAP